MNLLILLVLFTLLLELVILDIYYRKFIRNFGESLWCYNAPYVLVSHFNTEIFIQHQKEVLLTKMRHLNQLGVKGMLLYTGIFILHQNKPLPTNVRQKEPLQAI